MDFNNDKAIYIQIAERLCDEILADKYKEGERIPSVREYAVLLEVNANTTVKSYDLLATGGIIYNKRGLGYFVSPGAKRQIRQTRKREFMQERLPELARQMRLLDISVDEVEGEFAPAATPVAATQQPRALQGAAPTPILYKDGARRAS